MLPKVKTIGTLFLVFCIFLTACAPQSSPQPRPEQHPQPQAQAVSQGLSGTTTQLINVTAADVTLSPIKILTTPQGTVEMKEASIESPQAQPVPEPPLVIIIMSTNGMKVEEFIAQCVEGVQVASLDFVPTRGLDPCEAARKVINHFLENGERITRFGGWLGLAAFAEALASSNATYNGYAIAQDQLSGKIWFTVAGRQYMLVLTEKIFHNNTLYPVFAVEGKTILENVAYLLKNTAGATKDGLGVMGKLYLTQEGLRQIGRYLGHGAMPFETIQTGVGKFMVRFGECLGKEVKSRPEYEQAKNDQAKQATARASQFSYSYAYETSFYMSEEEAAEAAAILIGIGIVCWVIKIGVAGFTGQIYVLAIPTP